MDSVCRTHEMGPWIRRRIRDEVYELGADKPTGIAELDALVSSCLNCQHERVKPTREDRPTPYWWVA